MVLNATTRPLYSREGDWAPRTRVQVIRWARGQCGTGKENLASTGIWTPDLPSRSESLHLLSYLGRRTSRVLIKNKSSCVKSASGV